MSKPIADHKRERLPDREQGSSVCPHCGNRVYPNGSYYHTPEQCYERHTYDRINRAQEEAFLRYWRAVLEESPRHARLTGLTSPTEEW